MMVYVVHSFHSSYFLHILGYICVMLLANLQVIVCLYQGDIGPFNPGLQTEVPLWLAVSLKQRQKCRIVPPDWMDIGNHSYTWCMLGHDVRMWFFGILLSAVIARAYIVKFHL